MGCGKSSVGRRLSELLCCPFMDLDEEIEARAGRSIPEIFAEDGEGTFRKMELETLKGILYADSERLCTPLAPSHSGAAGPSPYAGVRKCQFRTSASPITTTILSLGGGTVMTAECAKMVHEHTRCIYLRASVDTLTEHLDGETANRPMLSGNSDAHSTNESTVRERISKLMALRSGTYERTAHVIIDTDGRSIDEIAAEIISKVRQSGV